VRPNEPLTNFLPNLYTGVKVDMQKSINICSSKMDVPNWTLNEELQWCNCAFVTKIVSINGTILVRVLSL
jgi:hypothetical protein